MVNNQIFTSRVRYKIKIIKDEILSDVFGPYKEIGKGFQWVVWLPGLKGGAILIDKKPLLYFMTNNTHFIPKNFCIPVFY